MNISPASLYSQNAVSSARADAGASAMANPASLSGSGKGAAYTSAEDFALAMALAVAAQAAEKKGASGMDNPAYQSAAGNTANDAVAAVLAASGSVAATAEAAEKDNKLRIGDKIVDLESLLVELAQEDFSKFITTLDTLRNGNEDTVLDTLAEIMGIDPEELRVDLAFMEDPDFVAFIEDISAITGIDLTEQTRNLRKNVVEAAIKAEKKENKS